MFWSLGDLLLAKQLLGQGPGSEPLLKRAKRHPKFWRSHIGVSQGGELERETI